MTKRPAAPAKKKPRLTRFDPVAYLTDEAAISEYLAAIAEECDEALMQHALRDVARARRTLAGPKRSGS